MSRALLAEKQGVVYVASTPGISNKAAPTVAELTANGTTILDLVGVADGEALVPGSVTGLTLSTTQIPVPDYVSRTTGKIAGTDEVDDISMTFYRDTTTNVIYANLDVDDEGFVAVFYGDQTPANPFPVEVWPVTVQQKVNNFTSDNEAATWTLSMASGIPTFGGTIAS